MSGEGLRVANRRGVQNRAIPANERTPNVVDAPEVMGLEEAAAFFGVASETLSKNLDEQAIPYRKIGKTYIFGKKALVDWANAAPNG